MAQRFTYGVFLPKKPGVPQRWARTNNRADAIKSAKKRGGEVRAMPFKSGQMTFDAPTFRTLSKRIYP